MVSRYDKSSRLAVFFLEVLHVKTGVAHRALQSFSK